MRVVHFVLTASLLLATAVAAPDTAKLRDQLALATDDKDDLSRIELLRRILDAEPGDTKSHQLLVELWLKIQDYDMAEAALNAWPDAPPRVAALARADILHSRDKDLAGAIKILQAYVATAPKDADAIDSLVQLLLATNDTKAQLAALDQLIPLRRDATNLIRRANVKFLLGDFTGALTDAKAAQALEPDSAVVKGAIPQYERLEEALKALPPLDDAIAKNPADFNALLDRSWWRRYGLMLEPALADANAAAKLEPDSLMARLAVTRALCMLNRLKTEDVLRDELIDAAKPISIEDSQVIAAADIALKATPNNTAQLAARAAALNSAGQYLLARRDAEAALAIDPKNAAAAIVAMTAATWLGNDKDAAELLRRIEAMKPDKAALAEAEGEMAEWYFEKGNLLLALELAEKSLKLNETRSITKVKATALQRLNRAKESKAAFDRAKKLPDDEK